jgi:hypothetical protein
MEMRFAQMKRILDELNRLCLRGLSWTTVEVPLTATAQNMRRLPLTPAAGGGNQVGLRPRETTVLIFSGENGSSALMFAARLPRKWNS